MINLKETTLLFAIVFSSPSLAGGVFCNHCPGETIHCIPLPNCVSKISESKLLLPISAAIPTISCVIEDRVTDADGVTTIESEEFNLGSSTSNVRFEARPWNGFYSIVDLSVETNGSLSLHMGDFCGERYFHSIYPSIADGVKATFSYGRDNNGHWKQLIAECFEE